MYVISAYLHLTELVWFFCFFVFSVQIAASCFTYVNGFRLSQPLLQLLTMVATKAIFSLFLEHRHLSHLCHAVPLIHVSPFSFPPPPPECNPLHVSLLESWTFVASLLWPAGLSTWQRRSAMSHETKSSGGPSSFHLVHTENGQKYWLSEAHLDGKKIPQDITRLILLHPQN